LFHVEADLGEGHGLSGFLRGGGANQAIAARRENGHHGEDLKSSAHLGISLSSVLYGPRLWVRGRPKFNRQRREFKLANNRIGKSISGLERLDGSREIAAWTFPRYNHAMMSTSERRSQRAAGMQG
jgi:hypothetical protein